MKSRDSWVAFTESVRELGVRRDGLVPTAATVVVLAEFAIVILLAVPISGAAVAGFGLAAGLLLIFGAAIATTLRRGVRTSCRCFGTSAAPLSGWHVVRNAVLVLVAAVGAIAATRTGSAQAAGLAVAACAGLLGGGLVAVLDDVVALFRSPRPA